MSTRINTNTTALQAASNLNTNSDALSTNIERLSSGLRINSAADDPAGLAISENFKAQISGLTTATSNSNDAINEVKTAEGALNQVQNLLISMRQLAVNASNLGTNSTTDLQADQVQINSAISSINQIASTTQFGNKYLLNGAATQASTTTAGKSVGTGITVAAQGLFNVAQAGSYNSISVTAATASTDTFAFTGGTLASGSGTDGTYSGSVIINGTQYNLSTTAPSSLSDLNSAISSSGYQAGIDTTGELVFTNQTTGAVATPTTVNISTLSVGTGNSIASSGTSGNGTAGTVTLSGGASTLSSTLANNTIATAGTLAYSVNGGAHTLSVTAGESLTTVNTALNANGVTLASTASALTLTATGSLSVGAFTAKVANVATATIGTGSVTGTDTTITPSGTTANFKASATFSQAGTLTFTDGASTFSATATAGEAVSTFLTAIHTADSNATATITGGNVVIASGSATTIAATAASNLTVGDAGSTETASSAAGVGGGVTFGPGSSTLAANGSGSLFAGTLTVSGNSGSSQVLTVAPGSTLAQLNADLSTTSVSASVDGSGNLIFSNVGSAGAPSVTLGANFEAYQQLTPSNPAGQYSNGSNATLTLSNATSTLTSATTQTNGGSNYYSFANGLVIASTVTSGTITGNLTSTAGATTSGQTLEFQIGANGGQTTNLDIASTTANLLGTGAANYVDANGTTQTVNTDSVADLNLMTFKGSQDAIAVIDQAINQVSNLRANLGAFQTNVLQSNVTSLGVAQQNMSSSLSTIEDTDLSTEIVSYTKNQILVQAATSALGQANQAPQAILKLLQ